MACLNSADRPFHNFAPLYEKHLWPFDELFFGNLRSVPVLRRLYDEQSEFCAKRSQRYCGASLFWDLKTIVLDSPVISSSVFHPIPSI